MIRAKVGYRWRRFSGGIATHFRNRWAEATASRGYRMRRRSMGDDTVARAFAPQLGDGTVRTGADYDAAKLGRQEGWR
jgi:hypothetical protein